MKRATLIALAAVMALVPAAPSAAAVDPERNASKPTGWHWWRGQTPAQLEQREKDAGERVISINADDRYGNRFSAALVKNSGPYARTGDWFHGKTADQVVALTKGKKRRLVDLEPYPSNFGKTHFAGVTVPNTGASGKGWRWNFDLSAAEVKSDIDTHEIRLVDLSVYKEFGKRRFAYVGIKNKGEDARKWWWYQDVSPDFVKAKAKEHKARLVDIERHGPKRQTVLMVRNEGVFSRSVYNVSRDYLANYMQSNAVRPTDLERHGDRYWATLIDNATPENARIRSIIRSGPWRDAHFGAFAKQTAGPVHVGLAHNWPYQPMSVLKLVPYLYVMDLVDRDPQVDLDDNFSWDGPLDPDKEICPGYPYATITHSDTVRNVLKDAMRRSLGRAHETLLNTYTPEAITARMHDPAIGLERTEIYYGCQHPGKKNFFSNRTTLAEMGELFEGVDTKKFFPNDWQSMRDDFYALMANYSTDWLRPVVEDEAAKQGKSGSVDQFMQLVSFDGKGGGWDSADSGSWVADRSFSYRITLPFKRSGLLRRGTSRYEDRSFVGGWFANGIPAPCHQATAAEKPESAGDDCLAWVASMDKAQKDVTAESQRRPIREALASW